jgi:CubicO group peptidase (beta-lactamase class C family)
MPSFEPLQAVRNHIQPRLTEEALPSLAIAVAQEGRILWEEGFGWADRENRIPASEHTLYSMASISKPITTTGLMVLAERSKIELDRAVNDYLGDTPLRARVGDAEGATVRRVANHTAGLPTHYHLFYADEPHPRPPMAETIRRYGQLVAPPGERYQYSNIGYGILDHLIARLSGTGYGDFLRREVFLPLGMTRASVRIEPAMEPFRAVRYGRDGLRVPLYDFDHPGASAVYYSAHDLVRFGMFHLKEHLPDQKSILGDATLDEMQRPTTSTGATTGYGIGWVINEDSHGYRTLSHTGGMVGVTTSLVLVPSERLAVVALANTVCDLPHVIVHEILAALLPGYGEKRAEAEAKRKAESEQAKPPAPPFQPPADLIGEWRGTVHTYQEEIELHLWFLESGDVHAQLGTQLKTLVNSVSLKEARLTGEMMGEIDTEDTRRRRHHLSLDLTRRGDALQGVLMTVVRPSERGGLSVSHWAELKRGG